MAIKTFGKTPLRKRSLEISKLIESCKVSQASNEIMLDRFYGGKNVEFPFAD